MAANHDLTYGSQSVQFRAIEAVSGLRDDHFLKALEEQGPMPEGVRNALLRPTLQALFERLLGAQGTTLDAVYSAPGPSVLFLITEGLLEYEQAFARWRFLHVQLVERMIGPITAGTGGTLGTRYLQRTVGQRFFPNLWDVRTRLYAGHAP
jgi:tryptophan 2,3-dioxygenase